MSINRWMDKEDVVHIYNGILLSHKNKVMPFAARWMDLEIIILIEVKQRQISYDTTYMWNLKKWYKWTYLRNRNRLTDSENKLMGTSLVAQWLRLCLPMQGIQVRPLGQEDPICHGATKPMSHNYWAGVLRLLKPHVPRGALQQEKPPQCKAHTPQQRVSSTRCH